jgi:dUTPase
MLNEMISIKWLALPHCPKGQLSKPGNSTDAGYDLMTAYDVYVPSFSELIEMGRYIWEPFKSLADMSEEHAEQVSTNKRDFRINKEGLVERRKFKFPLISTGVCIKPDRLMWNAICSRSGTSTKYGVSLVNSIGVVDRAYCGPTDELRITSYAIDSSQFFCAGDRIAQLIPMPQLITQLDRVDDVEEFGGSNRGGFNSTGM